MKAAILFHQKPSFLLLDPKRFGKKATRDFDRRVILAYQILEEETCQTCGTPVWLGHNDDNTLVFEVKDSTCYACADLEREREDIRKRSEGRESTRFGITEYVVPHRDGGTDPYGVPIGYAPLPTRDEAFEYMEKREKDLAVVSEAQRAGEAN